MRISSLFSSVVTVATSLLCGCSDGTSEAMLGAGAPLQADLVIKAKRAFSAASQDVISPAVVAIRDGKILAIGQNLSVIAPTTLDLADATILPGFVDTHIHMSGAWGKVQESLDALLNNGVTAVRDMGGEPDGLAAMRSEILGDKRRGPEIYFTGQMITARGGHPVSTLYKGMPTAVVDLYTYQVDTNEQAKAAVDGLSKEGVFQIKAILTSFGFQEFPTVPRLDPALLQGIATEGRQFGLRLAVHTDRVQDVLDAAQAGATSLEHGVTLEPITQAAIDVFSKIPYTPTLGLFKYAFTNDLPKRNLSAALSGHPIVQVGTDAPQLNKPWTLANYPEELAELVDAGMTPKEVLIAATRNSAAALVAPDGTSYLDRAGTLEVGKQADLVVVQGDPLADIRATRNVKLVVQKGKVVFHPE